MDAKAAFRDEGLTAGPCNLCPRMCGAARDRGHVGACGAADELVVARAALHYWEEPPLSGVSGSGAVFFSHCPLKCVYCQNATIAAGRAGVAISTRRLAEICLELQAQGALNVNFVTPTHYAAHIAEAVELACASGLALPVVWNTSGYERVEAIRALAGTADVYLADFKYAGEAPAKRYSQAPDYPRIALAAIGEMVEQVGGARYDVYEGQKRMTRGVVVRHLLLPGALDDSKAALAAVFERFGNEVRYSLMNQYTPPAQSALLGRFPELCGQVSPDDYEQLLDFADDLGVEDYFWQTGGAARESFIPEWDAAGVVRS